MSLLGIDVGSSSCKGVAFDAEGRALASATRPYQTVSPLPGRMEIDPDRFWQAVAAVAREVAAGTAADPVTALAVSCHGETIVPLDRRGAAAGAAIMSSDHRPEAQTERLARALGREEIHRVTGSPVHPMYGLCKMLWLREHERGYYDGVARFVSVHAFVLARMGLEPVSDFSLASRTMAFDIRTRDWAGRILEAAQVGPERLDLLRPAGTCAGRLPEATARELGLAPGTAVVVGGHDQPCGALGAGIVEPGQVCDSAGSFECLVAASAAPADPARAIPDALNSYCHVVPDRFVTLAFFPGGLASQWFLDQFCGDDRRRAEAEGRSVHEVMAEAVAACPPGPTGLCVTPYVVGSFNPRWNPEARGAMSGLRFSTTRHELYKAVFEGLACEQALNIAALESAVGPIGAVRIFGGNARSPFTVQLRADVTGRDMVLLDTPEAVCRGAAMLAGIGSGVYRDAADAAARAVRTGTVVRGDAGRRAAYAPQLARYRALYPGT